MSPARKPVIVRKWTRDWVAGYAEFDSLDLNPEMELIETNGKLLRIAWNSIKWLCFVRELGTLNSENPEKLLRRRFINRPRMNGLWLRLTLTDGEELEGVAPNDRSLIDGQGLQLIPPDTRSNTQRILLPRSSIRELTVLGVIEPPRSARTRLAPQPELFEPEPTTTPESDSPSESTPTPG